MNLKRIANDVSEALSSYEAAVDRMKLDEEREDMGRLIEITKKAIAALNIGDIEQAKLAAFSFSRQASDAFTAQPNEFKSLSEKMQQTKIGLLSDMAGVFTYAEDVATIGQKRKSHLLMLRTWPIVRIARTSNRADATKDHSDKSIVHSHLASVNAKLCVGTRENLHRQA